MSYSVVILVLGVLGLGWALWWAPRRFAVIAQEIDDVDRRNRFGKWARASCAVAAIGAAVLVVVGLVSLI